MTDPVANFAKILVQAKAVKPAVGVLAVTFGLSALNLADRASSPEVHWIATYAGGALLGVGVVAIAVYVLFPSKR
jgi:hypothetical protein